MSKSGKRSYGPNVQPVSKIEISDKNKKIRMILIVVLLAIGVVSIGIGVASLLGTEPGWETVEASSAELNCSKDFVFQYCYGQTEEAGAAEKKRLAEVYTEATENAYRIFLDEVNGICQNPGVPVTVDPALYEALGLIQKYENRCLYLGPVYVEYDRMFHSESEAEAASYDPGQNRELTDYISRIAAFANDPQSIDLVLLDHSQVMLQLSDAYQSFAEEYEITEFLDFGWMRNAFIADYLAQTLAQAGFTNGYLASYDGFTRNLDTRGEPFSFNLFDRLEDDINLPAVMEYSRPTSLVFLRNYPMSDRDSYHYYSFPDGRIATAFLDPADGMSKSATDNLVGCSENLSCSEILLQLAPVYLAQELDTQSLVALENRGITSVWFEDRVLYCTNQNLQIRLLADVDAAYTLEYVQ